VALGRAIKAPLAIGGQYMTEAVRLVIWDLDETFWHGTLTEGGYTYNQAAHDLVIELAGRGIMNSICSKNDFDKVRAILEEHGIWDYFIFPSINWEPKGPRIQALIETVQLRPETVLLIDDNPMNLQEALYFTPAMQTAAETFIAEIANSPLFKGKNDRELSRLKQYKLLERRKAEEAIAMEQSGGSNVEFLRSSNVRVRIEYDIEKHIDRAVELINRTNQLNFTKRRLPEDPEQARKALRTELSDFRTQAGLVEVFDNYGNYGYCGFFGLKTGAAQAHLTHYCFSCRILDMGVEQWLYQALGRPTLRIVGEVLSSPVKGDAVDWVTPVFDTSVIAADSRELDNCLDTVLIRGGCGEFNIVRNGIPLRLDHSLCLRYAMEGLPMTALPVLSRLGFEPVDFETKFFDRSGKQSIWVFNNWADFAFPIYRHRQTGLLVPFVDPTMGQGPEDERKTKQLQASLDYLDAEFDPEGFLSEDMLSANLEMIFSNIPAYGTMFVILPLEKRANKAGMIITHERAAALNRVIIEVAKKFGNVKLLPIDRFIEKDDEIRNSFFHLDRMVYFRLYDYVISTVEQCTVELV
jgi:FkbH-like protein